MHVEVRERAAYIHRPPLPGAGGLPVGCGGTAVTLLSGGIDSPVSTYMIAKRGVHMIPVHFFSFPYTSELAKQKVLDLAKELTAYCGRLTVEVVPFTHIQTEIRDKCPEEYFTLIGFDKEEIVRLSRKIGTFELSTLPYEDCCTVFTPRHPRTRPRIDAVEEAEAVLDIEGLVAEAMAGIERVRFDP